MSVSALWNNSLTTTYAPPPTRVAPSAAEKATPPAQLDPQAFLAWPDADQVAYVQQRGSPLTIGSGDNAISVSIAANQPGRLAEVQPIPYHYLPGSASGGSSPAVQNGAEALFPSLDGVTTRLPANERPDGFDTNVATLTSESAIKAFAAKFSSWHSAYQLEFLKKNGNVLSLPPSGKPIFNAFVSSTDPRKHYIIQSLDKNTIARMSTADQAQLAALPGFSAIAGPLGLTKADAAVFPGGMTAGQYLDKMIADIDASKTTNINPKTNMPDADRAAFTSQLAILKEQLAASGVINAADIQKKVTELKERFDRAFAFFDVIPPSVVDFPNDGNIWVNVITIDGDISGLQRGYQVFIAQEKRIAELAEARMRIVRDNGVLFGKQLDVPYLVAQFQSLYNSSLESQVVMETEEINQQNDLLKTYAKMQDAVNRTLSSFAKADEKGKPFLNKTGQGDIQESERRLYAMFDTEANAGVRQKHPLETLRKLERPLFDFVADKGTFHKYTHPQWSTFATRLSDTVTIINQNSQIKMNDVNSLDKQRNRHFELANNALAKMNDIIQSIGRL